VPEPRATRGHGLLEGFLSRRRAHRAKSLIPPGHSRGRILDIGCGSYPLFLAGVDFAERYGLDRVPITRPAEVSGKLTLLNHDVHEGGRLPFEDGFFDAVTMLAVFEHIEPAPLAVLLAEVRRVLRPGGVFVMTTPAHWTGPLLELLTRVGMVSGDEIHEHQGSYGRREIRAALEAAGFAPAAVRVGFFEAGMNNWATATA
jgi:SAM-dependent methyltransferase